MDHFWLKNLAQAFYSAQGWLVPEELQNDVSERAKRALHDLQFEAHHIVQTFNQLVPETKHISVKSILGPDGQTLAGFVFFSGPVQVRLLGTGAHLEIHRHIRDGFSLREDRLHQLEAVHDPFGDLRWAIDRKELLTSEMIIRKILVLIWEKVNTLNW